MTVLFWWSVFWGLVLKSSVPKKEADVNGAVQSNKLQGGGIISEKHLRMGAL